MKFLFAGLAAFGILTTSATAVMAEWAPSGPIKLTIAFAAGGGADTQARLIAEEIEKLKGWNIIPENVTGRGGLNALAALKGQPADGTAIAIAVTESLGYNMVAAESSGLSPADFTPLTTTAGFQMGLVVKADTGWTSFDDVIAAAKGGKDIRLGAMSPKLADLAYLLGKESGVEFNIAMLRGGRAVMDAVTAGDVDIGWGGGIQNRAVRAGEMVNLVSGLSTPLDVSPDAPRLEDLGVNFNADGYFVFVAPADLPDEARMALADALASVAADENSKAGGMIKNAFGGSAIIKGDALDALIAEGFENSGALIEASQ